MTLPRCEDMALAAEILSVCPCCGGAMGPHERPADAAKGMLRCAACGHLDPAVPPRACDRCGLSISRWAKVWYVCRCGSVEARGRAKCSHGHRWSQDQPGLCYTCAHGFPPTRQVSRAQLLTCVQCGGPRSSHPPKDPRLVGRELCGRCGWRWGRRQDRKEREHG